jgi:hypothetical protein
VRRELLIGCGNNRIKCLGTHGHTEWEGLVTLDDKEDCGADIVHDLEDIPYPFQDEEFDEIHAYCVLEHCGRQGDYEFFFAQFTEFWRILKPRGLILGYSPKPDSLWAFADPSHTRVIAPETLKFLQQSSYLGVGQCTISDFRSIYKVDFEVMKLEDYDMNRHAFCLIKQET